MTRPVLRTPLCDLVGVEYPIISAGMGAVGGSNRPAAVGELAAAVSNAGGLGMIGGAGLNAAQLREEIAKVRRLTSKPFGVDLLLPAKFGSLEDADGVPADPRKLVPPETREALRHILEGLGVPYLEAPPDVKPTVVRKPGAGFSDEQMEVVIEERVPVFAAGLGSPGPWIERLHANGTVVLSLVGNSKNARRVAQAGVDVVVAQGTEAGGHTGRVATMALVPQVVDCVAPTPVVAAGGIGDGRGVAAALALGAIGVWCGSAFLASYEANIPEVQKQRMLNATDEDTKITKLYSGKTMRNVTNPLIDAWEASGIQALPMVLQGVLTRDVIHSARQAGRPELLMNAAGQVSGLLRQTRPAADILAQMAAEASEILTHLPSYVQAPTTA